MEESSESEDLEVEEAGREVEEAGIASYHGGGGERGCGERIEGLEIGIFVIERGGGREGGSVNRINRREGGREGGEEIGELCDFDEK